MAYHGECQLVLVVEVRRRCIHWVRAAFHGQLIIVKTYPVNDPSIRVATEHARERGNHNSCLQIPNENAVTTMRTLEMLQDTHEMLQSTHENAATTSMKEGMK